MSNLDGWKFGLGLLLILGGAMPLNGWIGFQLFPEQFHFDGFVGSVWHLLIGALSFLSGIILVIRVKARLLTTEVFKGFFLGSIAYTIVIIPLFMIGKLKLNGALSGWVSLVVLALCCVSFARLVKGRHKILSE